MNIGEIKNNVKSMISKSVEIAKDVTEHEKNLLLRNKIIAEAKATGRQKAIEYLYSVIEKLLKK